MHVLITKKIIIDRQLIFSYSASLSGCWSKSTRLLSYPIWSRNLWKYYLYIIN